MESIVSNQPPVSFEANREHDQSQNGWIEPRTSHQHLECRVQQGGIIAFLLGSADKFTIVSGLGDKTSEKIYYNVDSHSMCFRRLNGTHQIGCTCEFSARYRGVSTFQSHTGSSSRSTTIQIHTCQFSAGTDQGHGHFKEATVPLPVPTPRVQSRFALDTHVRSAQGRSQGSG